MFRKAFEHNKILYEFKWAKRQSVLDKMPESLRIKLEAYLNQILQNNIPYDLFNDMKVTRCSNFRLKNLPRGSQKNIGESLIEEKFVINITNENSLKDEYPYIHDFMGCASKMYWEYENSGYNGIKPGHDEILTAILLTLEGALSVETPVWTRKQTQISDFLISTTQSFNFSYKYSLTGHIDLLYFDQIKNEIIVIDYKPEEQFLRSLPQVATYGLLIQRILQIKNVKCLSFSKDQAWLYSPEILRHQIEEKLIKFGNPTLKWRKIIKEI